MRRFIDGLIDSVNTRVLGLQQETADEDNAKEELAELAVELEEARREWLAARAYFESVSDPELVDHAIHLVLAREKRYTYLLKEAKRTYGGLSRA